jgi:regulatory protein
MVRLEDDSENETPVAPVTFLATARRAKTEQQAAQQAAAEQAATEQAATEQADADTWYEEPGAPQPVASTVAATVPVLKRVPKFVETAVQQAPAPDDAIDDDDDEEDDSLRLVDLERLVVRALARKDLSEWEVTQLLAANGVEPDEFEELLVDYRAKRYVDDFAYAERQVEALHRRKGFGRSQISRELGSKRISSEIITDVLATLDDDDELARALALAEKRAPSLSKLDHATAERRLTSFLQRKGYPHAVIREVVAKTLVPVGLKKGSSVRFR